MNRIIRLALPADRSTVETIVHDAYRHYIPRVGRPPGPMLDDYAALIAANRVHVLELDGVVRGILVLLPEDDAMLLDNIAVSPGMRGTGIGRQLLEFAELQAREAGYRTIRLYTNAAMTENITLYTKIGYVETHRGEVNGLRRVYMTKPLEI
jgi:GNAT superfamily N-acetyltransferase